MIEHTKDTPAIAPVADTALSANTSEAPPSDLLNVASNVEFTPREALAVFLAERLPDLYPRTFATRPGVEVFAGAGVSGCFFTATSDEGLKYFVKPRTASDYDIVGKEKAITDLAASLGVPVARILDPVTIPVEALPESIAGLDTLAVKGRNAPITLNIQSFEGGIEAHSSIEDHALQCTVYKSLGDAMRKLHDRPVVGFGSEFSTERGTFGASYDEFASSLVNDVNLPVLVERQILSRVEGLAVEAAIKRLRRLDPEAVLCHTDLNPGNFKHDTDGNVTLIVDWETAHGAPWQFDVALALNKIEASQYKTYVPFEERRERAEALLAGYGLTAEELERAQPIIDAFRLLHAVQTMNTFYVTYGRQQGRTDGFVHTPGEYESTNSDSYRSASEYFYANQDFTLGLLEHEAIAKKLMHGA